MGGGSAVEDCEARRDRSVTRRDEILSEKNEQSVPCGQWRKPGAEFGGTEQIFADHDDVFFRRNFHFGGKNF